MPSLLRFVLILAVLAGIVLAIMLALVFFVHVTPRPMEEIIPPARLR